MGKILPENNKHKLVQILQQGIVVVEKKSEENSVNYHTLEQIIELLSNQYRTVNLSIVEEVFIVGLNDNLTIVMNKEYWQNLSDATDFMDRSSITDTLAKVRAIKIVTNENIIPKMFELACVVRPPQPKIDIQKLSDCIIQNI